MRAVKNLSASTLKIANQRDQDIEVVSQHWLILLLVSTEISFLPLGYYKKPTFTRQCTVFAGIHLDH